MIRRTILPTELGQRDVFTDRDGQFIILAPLYSTLINLPYPVTIRCNRGSIFLHHTANVEYNGIACR
jgi:hypothetical protein